MNITQIRQFTTVARLESMSRAAQLLHVTQSALSKSVSQLERELGTALFDRSGKRLRLNASGERFLECCEKMLRELDSAQADLRMMTSGHDHRLNIGSVGSGAHLIDCLAEFSRRHPEAELNLQCGLDGSELPDISRFDALVYPDNIKYRKFSGYPLYEDRYFAAVPAGHALCARAAVSLGQLEGESMVFLRRGDSVEYPFNACAALNIRPGKSSFADTRQAHRALIAAGAAVGFVPASEKDEYLRDDGIRLLPVMDGNFFQTFCICFRREKYLSELGKVFRDFAVEYFKL